MPAKLVTRTGGPSAFDLVGYARLYLAGRCPVEVVGALRPQEHTGATVRYRCFSSFAAVDSWPERPRSYHQKGRGKDGG